MRIRKSLSIGMLAGAAAAISLYLLTRPEIAAESPGTALPVPASHQDPRELYCAERTPANGVVVNTGAGCAHAAESTDSHPPTVTVTRGPEALVITGSDP